MTPSPLALTVPARQAEVVLDADVVVCGGGPAGLGAALAAARSGASVALLERYGFLGGNFTVAAVGTMCGLYVRSRPGSFDEITGGLARSFAVQLMARGAALGPYPFKDTAVLLYVPWAAKRLADHLITEGPDAERISLVLHALVADVVRGDDGDVTGVVIASKRGPQAVTGRVFVDATGDADVAVAAGVPWAMGAAGERQFGSMQFFIQNADVDAAMAAGLGALSKAIAEHGAALSREGGAVIPTFRPGEFLGAMVRLARDGRPLDATDLFDLTWGELEGRRRAEQAMEFLRAHMPGFEEAFLADTATQQGVRETRHIVGRTVLTGADVVGQARFDDGVVQAAWPQEYHVRDRGTEYEFLPDGASYQIPFAALVPFAAGAPRNLLVAGRCISADHDALASCRVMAPCFAMGEAAGVAAAMTVRDKARPDVSTTDVCALRDELVARDAVLL
jgi:glycine/D-amino acid oxidase-like deaminating enzyme